jgi:hypothetical protein
MPLPSGASASSTSFRRTAKPLLNVIVSAAALLIVSWLPAMDFTSASTSRRPSRIAAAISGPRSAPKTAPAILFACAVVLAFLIALAAFSKPAARSVTPPFALRVSSTRRAPSTSLAFTPSFSNLPTSAAAWSKPMPSSRSGAP